MSTADSYQRPWAALAAATLVGLPLGCIYAFSVFLKPLEVLLSVSRSELASVFGLSTVFFTVGSNLAPRLFNHFSAPLMLLACTLICACGVGLSAVADGFSQVAIGYGVLFAIGGGMAYSVVQQGVNQLALRRTGLVNGYLISLFPAGAMLAAPLFGWAIDAWGVRAALAGLAVTLAVTGILAVGFFVAGGVRLGGTTIAGGGDGATGHWILFWKLFGVFFLAASAGLMVLSQAAAIVAAYGGAGQMALFATTGITAAIAAARLTGGWLVDRLPVPLVAAGAHLLALAGGIVLSLWPSAEVAVVTLAMIGIGYGIISGVTMGSVAFYWPKQAFGRIVGRMYVAWCLAAITLPVLAARLFDLSGGYQTAVLVAGGVNLLGALLGLSLPRQNRN